MPGAGMPDPNPVLEGAMPCMLSGWRWGGRACGGLPPPNRLDRKPPPAGRGPPRPRARRCAPERSAAPAPASRWSAPCSRAPQAAAGHGSGCEPPRSARVAGLLLDLAELVEKIVNDLAFVRVHGWPPLPNKVL